MDIQAACQSPLADRYARFWTRPKTGCPSAAGVDSAETSRFSRLARLMLIVRHRDFVFRRREMTKLAKFEAFAFACGFIMTGFVTLVALPLA